MSLFQVRQWWQVKCSMNEEFDQNHLIVGNIDNDPNNIDKIMVASLEGVIRIYLPTNSDYKVEHLILESNLKQAILQIAIGRFLSNDKSNYLAILHSRQLCIYQVLAIGGYGNKAQYYQLNKRYSHNLDRNAFNFIYGPFGQRSHGNNHYYDDQNYSDSICVQSLDGKFWVFEQEHFAFSREWNNFLIPGCIVYAPYNDSIITMTSEMKLYSYNYAVLSTSQQQKTQKSFHKNWSINLCDHGIKIICCRFTQSISPSDHDIIVLCQRGLFVISTSGIIKWQNKLEYDPSTMISYRAKNTDSGWIDNLIIANFQNNISIYSQCQLIWSARLHFNVIDICIGSFAGCHGMQILLSDDGYLMIGYLGTDPSGYKPIHIQNREPNWDEIENQMKETKNIINSFENNKIIQPNDYLSLELIQHNDDDHDIQWIEDNTYLNQKYQNKLICDSMKRLKVYKTKLIIKYNGKSQYGLSQIEIIIEFDNNTFICNQNNNKINIDTMTILNNKYEFDLLFYAKKTAFPHDRNVNIHILYLNENDKLQSNKISFKLPIYLLLYTSTPIKNTNYVFTLEINGINPPSPTDLFNDLIDPKYKNQILKTPQILTMITYFNNYDITILLSRKGGKIRIQSANLYPIWIVIDEILLRLNNIAIKKDAILVSLKDDLPLNIYLENISNRYNILCEIRNYEKNLEKLANQFRVIQKRLLTRYKNKNPTPLNEMDILLKNTYQNIINDTNKLESLNIDFKEISDKLWNLTHLLWILIKMKYKLDENNFEILQNILPIGDGENGEISEGWEEQIESALVYVLRTCLAKSKKDKKISQHKIGKIRDINKVMRHIKIVCDRLEKGQRFI